MDAVVAMFEPAPPQLKALIKRAGQAVQAMSAIRTQLLAVADVGAVAAAGGGGSGGGGGGAGGSGGGHEPEAAARREVRRETLAREGELWEGEQEWSFFSMAFDAASGERRQIVSNERTAELLGMRREEMLARYACREMDVPLLEADWLANFLHELELAEETRVETFVRIAVGRRQRRRPALVRSVKVKHFDAGGQVTRVRARPPAVARRGPRASPAEPRRRAAGAASNGASA
jgi:hypothetical protein